MRISVLLVVIAVSMWTKEASTHGVCGEKKLIQVSGLVTWELKNVEFEAQVSLEPAADEADMLDMTVVDIAFDNTTETFANLSSEIRLPVRISANGSTAVFDENEHSDASILLKQTIFHMLPQSTFVKKKTEDIPNFALIEETLALLKEGHEKNILSDEYKNVVLVLGNTGAGKSTFTHWIAENSSRLIGKEVIEGLGEYIIEDSLNKIGNSTIDSKTTFPELVVDVESNTAFYDFPGFSDTRDSSHDIAQSYFIEKTIDHIDTVKMIFVINYPSVRKGVDRQDFITLLRYLTDIVKDIDKFKDSCAMVVTKVDNQYMIGPKGATIIEDEKVINGIAFYLQEAKRDLELRISTNTTDATFYKNAIKLIDVLLTKNNKKYTKIGLFRRPDDEGPLSDREVLQNEKKFIKNLIYNELTFMQKSNDDIGRTISERSKNSITFLVQEIDKEMLFSFCDLAQQAKTHYLKKENYVNDKIKAFDVQNLTRVNFRLLELDQSLQKFDALNGYINNLISNIKSSEVGNIPKIITDSAVSIGVETVNNNAFLNIEKFSFYLDVLQNASQTSHNASFSTLVWASTFESILSNLTVSNNHLHLDVQGLQMEIDSRVKQNINDFSSQLLKIITKIEENINVENLLKELKMKRINFNVIFGQTNFKSIDNINEIALKMNISFPDGIESKVEYFQLLEIHVLDFFKYINNAEVWYNFLLDLYKTISTYKFQKKINDLNSFLKDMSLLNAGKSVSHTLPKEIIEIMTENNLSNSKILENITLNKIQLSHLQRLVSISLQKPDQTCETNGKLVVKGVNVKLSDVSRMKCNGKIKIIEILALNRVFFDVTRFDKTGADINMAVIAPTWDIQDVCDILLDGLDNNDHRHKANSGYYGGIDGTDGQPGFPGGSAGHFYGIGKTFINSLGLSISANGGDGGTGQNGGDGARGSDGNTPYIGDPKSYLKSHGLYNNENAYNWHWVYTDWKVYGERCSSGGDGGKGGHGGTGGYPGTITIKALGEAPWIETSTKKGHFGANGVSGEPGGSGRPGTLVKIYWAPFRFWDQTSVEYSSLGWCKSGTKPRSLNSVGFRRANANNEIIVNDVKNDYKKFFEKKVEELPVVTPIKEFVTKI